MANGYCDAKYCRSPKAISYQWGGKEYQLCGKHNEVFCDKAGGDETGMKKMIGGDKNENGMVG